GVVGCESLFTWSIAVFAPQVFTRAAALYYHLFTSSLHLNCCLCVRFSPFRAYLVATVYSSIIPVHSISGTQSFNTAIHLPLSKTIVTVNLSAYSTLIISPSPSYDTTHNFPPTLPHTHPIPKRSPPTRFTPSSFQYGGLFTKSDGLYLSSKLSYKPCTPQLHWLINQ